MYISENIYSIDCAKRRNVTTPDWPPVDLVEQLVEKAEGLFIFASTVVKFIEGDGGPAAAEFAPAARRRGGVTTPPTTTPTTPSPVARRPSPTNTNTHGGGGGSGIRTRGAA